MVEPWHPQVAYVALSGPRPHIEALADDGYRLIARLEDGDEETALIAAGHPESETVDDEWAAYRASRRLADELGRPIQPVVGGHDIPCRAAWPVTAAGSGWSRRQA